MKKKKPQSEKEPCQGAPDLPSNTTGAPNLHWVAGSQPEEQNVKNMGKRVITLQWKKRKQFLTFC